MVFGFGNHFLPKSILAGCGYVQILKILFSWFKKYFNLNNPTKFFKNQKILRLCTKDLNLPLFL